MSKVVKAINSMITNDSKISNVIKSGDELFFLYDKKHKWSMGYVEDRGYFLHFYPSTVHTIEEISSISSWDSVSFVTFKSEDINTREATETFKELYQILQGKLYGIDDVLNEIIGDGNDLPF